ncbi:MAG: hypothetical protein LBQ22_01360 [Bacteroidales bacterium]|jgi:hypothetical protein|nr:hypothetical protein [Bacteroidales bacterium]
MNKLSKQIKNILKKEDNYPYDISRYREVISYIPYFQEINEGDYIIYHDDHTFEYTPQFYSFIKALFDAKLVEDKDTMNEFLKEYRSESSYKLWMKDMNMVLDDEKLLSLTNLSLLKKIIFSLINLENVLQGSWGIDAESGNWLKILIQLRNIFPRVFKTETSVLH